MNAYLLGFLLPLTSSSSGADTQLDAEALAIVSTINSHEILAAQRALRSGMGASAIEYAGMLLREHQANQAKTDDLILATGIAPSNTDAVIALKAKTQATRDRLDALEGDAFETAFIDAMVDDHRAALATIDDELLPRASPEVAEHLRTTRDHIALHLERARELKQNPTH